MKQEKTDLSLQQQELLLFIQAMKLRFGYDFSQYKPDSLLRRVNELVRQQKLQHISDLIPLVFYRQDFLSQAIATISVGVTEFFREPEVYQSLLKHVVPLLKTYSRVKVWSAGCSTGEEAYSLAILLKEADLIRRTTIYATDINMQAIEQCKTGIYKHHSIKQDCINYQESGGLTSFSDYYTTRYQMIKLSNDIMQTVSFNQHNLVTDGVFCEAQLIVCRNVMIYFDAELQSRVLNLFSAALARNCFLLLGSKDCLYVESLDDSFEVVDKKTRLYRKK